MRSQKLACFARLKHFLDLFGQGLQTGKQPVTQPRLTLPILGTQAPGLGLKPGLAGQ